MSPKTEITISDPSTQEQFHLHRDPSTHPHQLQMTCPPHHLHFPRTTAHHHLHQATNSQQLIFSHLHHQLYLRTREQGLVTSPHLCPPYTTHPSQVDPTLTISPQHPTTCLHPPATRRVGLQVITWPLLRLTSRDQLPHCHLLTHCQTVTIRHPACHPISHRAPHTPLHRGTTPHPICRLTSRLLSAPISHHHHHHHLMQPQVITHRPAFLRLTSPQRLDTACRIWSEPTCPLDTRWWLRWPVTTYRSRSHLQPREITTTCRATSRHPPPLLHPLHLPPTTTLPHRHQDSPSITRSGDRTSWTELDIESEHWWWPHVTFMSVW